MFLSFNAPIISPPIQSLFILAKASSTFFHCALLREDVLLKIALDKVPIDEEEPPPGVTPPPPPPPPPGFGSGSGSGYS